jgi:predicted dehydrogenase/nucleoside-diphosphate-sugar epimerase
MFSILVVWFISMMETTSNGSFSTNRMLRGVLMSQQEGVGVRMRVAIIGCGQISRVHISALQEIEGLEICAVCDRDVWRARDIANVAGGAAAYSDLAALLQREHPDAVHVLTPPTTHAELAIQAMESGCHVLVEKPMAISVEEADSMLAAARENGVKLCASHNYLFKPSIAKARQLVESGAIGQVVHVDSYYGLAGEGGSYGGSSRSHWAWRLPGGVFSNFIPHLIYLQLAFLQNVDSVDGVSMAPAGESGVPVAGLTVLLQGTNASGVMTVSMRAKPYAKFVDIYGTKGIIHADLVREVCTVNKDWRLPRMLSKAILNLEDSIQLAWGTLASTAKVLVGSLKNMPGLHVLIREFYASILNDQKPPVPGEDGRRVAEIMEMIWTRSQGLPLRPAITDTVSVITGPRTEAERRVAKKGMPGKVLVIGANGFLGHRLVGALARCGADIVALVRDKDSVSLELERQAEIVCGDLRDPASIEAAMRNMSIVYHCAAVTTNVASWTTHYETNVLGTETVLKEALKAGVQRVVHASSVIVYGLARPPHGDLISETTSLPDPPDLWAHYLRSKQAADRLAFDYWREARLPITVLRLGILYGPGGRSPGRGLIQLGPLRLTIGRGRNQMPYTYVGNAVDCMLLAVVSPEAIGQAYNVVDEPQITPRDVASQTMKITGERCIPIPVPPFLLSNAARLLEWKSEMTHSETPPKLSRFVVRSAGRNLRYDTRKAREQLGWQPSVTLEEGLRMTFGDKSFLQ